MEACAWAETVNTKVSVRDLDACIFFVQSSSTSLKWLLHQQVFLVGVQQPGNDQYDWERSIMPEDVRFCCTLPPDLSSLLPFEDSGLLTVLVKKIFWELRDERSCLVT